MTTILLILCAAGLVVRTQDCAQAAREALMLCIETVVPSLFPFMVLSSLLIGCGAADALGRRLSGLMRPLFGLSGAGAGALALGLVGGYPVGARTAAELVRSGALEKNEGERLLAFCNNAGPGFILGVCGGAVLQSGRAGTWLYLVHVLSALLTGMLLRGGAANSRPKERPCEPVHRLVWQSVFSDASLGHYGFPSRCEHRLGMTGFFVEPIKSTPPQKIPTGEAMGEAVRSACVSMASVCGFVVVFTVLLHLTAGLTDVLPTLLRAALMGALELTSGVLALPNSRGGFVLCAALLGWGGLSVHAQSRAMLAGSGLRGVYLVRGKLLHALLSAALALFVAPWALA